MKNQSKLNLIDELISKSEYNQAYQQCIGLKSIPDYDDVSKSLLFTSQVYSRMGLIHELEHNADGCFSDYMHSYIFKMASDCVKIPDFIFIKDYVSLINKEHSLFEKKEFVEGITRLFSSHEKLCHFVGWFIEKRLLKIFISKYHSEYRSIRYILDSRLEGSELLKFNVLQRLHPLTLEIFTVTHLISALFSIEMSKASSKDLNSEDITKMENLDLSSVFKKK